MTGGLSLSVQRYLFSRLLRSTPLAEGTTVLGEAAVNVPAAWVIPPDARNKEVLFYLHGGGYTWSSIQSHRHFVSQIVAAVGCRALLVEYRLAPEYPFPAALEDALTAYQWLCEREPGSRIAIAGESAGAGLAVSTMLSLPENAVPPVAGFLLSPWADLTRIAPISDPDEKIEPSWVAGRLSKTAESYANGENLADPRISPVYGDLSGLPPILIHGGRKEFLGRDALVLYEWMRQQNVEVFLEHYEGGMHAVHSFVHLSKQARDFLQKAALFLREHLDADSGS